MTPAPEPSSTPIFATEDEALAAATAAYAAYVKMSDQILMDGGRDPDRIRPLARKDALDAALDGYTNFRDKAYRSIGSSVISNEKLQQYSPESRDGSDLVGIYACLDVSGVDVVDVSGNSVVSSDRPDRQAFQLTFDLDRESQQLVLASREAWSNAELCGL